MEVTIREARRNDARALINHIQRLAEEPDIYIPLYPGEFNLTVEQEKKVLADFAASANSIFLVAEANSRIVGELSCKGHQRQAMRHTATLGMSVRKEYRGQGVGSSLMAHIIEWARENEIVKRLELQVYARNEPALALYHKYGFEIEGRRRRAIFQRGEYHDALLMALLL